MIQNNDQIQFSEKNGKFRDGETQQYFVVKMVVSNHSSPRIVLEIGYIPIEQMDEFHAWISIHF